MENDNELRQLADVLDERVARRGAILALKELAETARDQYLGLAAYDRSDREVEMANFIVALADETAERLTLITE